MGLVMDLKDRVALVTGGSRGIGRAVALALAEAGADVVVGASKPGERLDQTRQDIERLDRRAAAAVGDLSRPEVPDMYVRTCMDQFGRLDILVNNAGIWEEAAIDELTPEFLHRTISLNLGAAFLLCSAATPLLRESPAGRIVNISSTASLMGEPMHSAYAASKGGLDALTRSLAVELGPAGITVNSVAPGWTVTDMTAEELETDAGRELTASIPLGKVARVEDVAYAVAYLASDWAGHVSGVTLPVEGAYRIRR